MLALRGIFKSEIRMAEYNGVLICGELTEEKKVAYITLEMLGIGRKLAADLKQDLSLAVMGSEMGNVAPELIAFGAQKVYLLDSPLLQEYQPDFYVAALERLCNELKPDIVLIGQTSIGQDIAPRLAFRLNTMLVTDCIDLAIDPETRQLLKTKMVYGGNALAVYASPTKPQMATVRAKAMSSLERDDARKGEVIPFDPQLDASLSRTEVVEKVKVGEGVRLEDADVVVSGGRGIGSAEGFEQLRELSRLLGGATGASRVACDQGWVPITWQVGLTGKIISPDLYIAVAISGASQHLAGISGAKKIVAINKDREANIFKVADYGVVGNYEEVIPAFIEKVRESASK